MSNGNLIRVGITGQSGFIGSHLYNSLKLTNDFSVVSFHKSFFDIDQKLIDFISECDVIIHLAGLNRHPNPDVIYDTNIELTQKIIASCDACKKTPHILFASSIQEENGTAYGNSKKRASELLNDWSIKTGAKVSSLVIPNVFGPFGRPFYNSVVSTFCNQFANHQMPEIINDGNLKLIYVNHLVNKIIQIIKTQQTGKIEIEHQYELKVSELFKKLQDFYSKYLKNGEFPSIAEPFDLDLFNTFRCYIAHDFYPKPFIKHTDDRGIFVEIVRANTSGQFSFSTTKPGITRGNHFHTRKAERFAVIKGKASIQLRKIDADMVVEYLIDGSEPAYVDMPIWHVHNITNVGEEELITLFWINEPFSPEDPDTYFVNV